jgi:class 3 adenylate cyclase
VREPEVRFAEHEESCIAYAVFGTGPCDLLVYQYSCPIDLMWQLPQLAAFMEALGGMARVIVYDPRGQGASDPMDDPGAATLETSCDDALAVLNAAGVERATFLDMAGGMFGLTHAATYPQRMRSLIVNNLLTSGAQTLGNLSVEDLRSLARARVGVGTLEMENPRSAHDPVLREWWGRARRLLTNPKTVLSHLELAARSDVAPVLPSVRVPTLVLHRRDNPVFDLASSRAAANLIPNARFVELPGSDTDLFLGDTAPALAEIERFLAEPEVETAHDRVLATVLFTDIVGSTEQLAARGDDEWRHVLDTHDQTMDRVITNYRGRLVKQTGDGILATFDGPARAVRCAAAILENAREQGITLRAGLHTGEIELRPSDVAGIAVHAASRIAALADPNEILVSRTVVDLTAGSGLQFAHRGEHKLKGVPGSWPLFAVQEPT